MNKLEVFQKQLKKPKELFLVFIAAMGLKHNVWSDELINGGIVELKDLF